MKSPDDESPLTEYKENVHSGVAQPESSEDTRVEDDEASPLSRSLPDRISALDVYVQREHPLDDLGPLREGRNKCD